MGFFTCGSEILSQGSRWDSQLSPVDENPLGTRGCCPHIWGDKRGPDYLAQSWASEKRLRAERGQLPEATTAGRKVQKHMLCLPWG